MSKRDLPKYQSCILKVNIHCEGCEHKVRKLLQKIDGVYSVSIDAESGKVLVAGNVDPAKLLKKLKRSGKYAELWGGQRGMMYHQNYPPTNQFKNLQIDPTKMVKHNESQKVGKNQQKGVGGGGGQLPNFQNRGAKNLMVPAKDLKSVKFNVPEEEFDASDDELDDFDDDEFDDYDDEEEDEEESGHNGHGHPMMRSKMGGMGMGNGRGPPGMMMGPVPGRAMNVKRGDVIDLPVQMKCKGGNNEWKKGKGGGGKKGNEDWGGGKKNKKAGNKGGDKKNTKGGGGFLGRFLGFGKKSKKAGGGADTPRFKKNGAPPIKGKEGKKGGGRFEGRDFKKVVDDDFQDFDIPVKGKSGKGGKPNGMGKVGHMGPPMDQMRNIQAVQGLPAAMNGGYYQGMQMQMQPPLHHPHPLPYNQQQQQYMAMMMSQQQHQQQQRANMNNMYPAMMYGRPQGPMNYMPPPPPMPSHPMADPITHVFSDENTESCTIM